MDSTLKLALRNTHIGMANAKYVIGIEITSIKQLTLDISPYTASALAQSGLSTPSLA